MNILVIGGSNSATSINRQLAHYATSLLEQPAIDEVHLTETVLPLYGIDLEQRDGIPDVVHTIRDQITAADGLVISLAEHNGSYSVAFKNMLDWVSRIDGQVWQDKPMLLMATSPGGRGGASVLETAAAAFPHFGGNIVATYSLPTFQDAFVDGRIVNDAKAAELQEKVALLAAAVSA